MEYLFLPCLLIFIISFVTFVVCYLYFLTSPFDISAKLYYLCVFFPPAMIYLALKYKDKSPKYARVLLISLIITLSTVTLMFMSVRNALIERSQQASTSSVTYQFEYIEIQLLEYKKVNGHFPSTSEGFDSVAVIFTGLNQIGEEVSIDYSDTRYGPILYTLESPEHFTLRIPTSETNGLDEDFVFVHDPDVVDEHSVH